MNTYTVTVHYEDKWWVAETREVSATTQARRLSDTARRAKDAIASRLDCDPADFEIDVTVILPAGVEDDLVRELTLRQEAARIQADAAEARRSAASRLAQAGLTVREIGGLLGVSHQRAHQLVRGKSPVA